MPLVNDQEPQYDLETVAIDVRSFFTNENHWIYQSKGTPFLITPNSVYHITQLQVLFEDRYVHRLTYDAIQKLRGTFLVAQDFPTRAGTVTLVWKKGLRYVRRQIKEHLRLVEEYSSQPMNKATGDYAELLTLMGLSRLHLALVDRNTNTYRGRTWQETGHDLDFIVEKNGQGYGIEVKNTFDYMPLEEFSAKLQMCQFLGLRPLFIVRARHPEQWARAKAADGLVFMFKTKIFPPGQEGFVRRIWQHMRLPVQVWLDWRPSFYDTIRPFTQVGNYSS